MGAQSLEHDVRCLGTHADDGFALIRDVERVEPENLGGGANYRGHGYRGLFDEYAHSALLSHLRERAGQATTGWIFHRADRSLTGIEGQTDQLVERGHVRPKVSVQAKAAAHGHQRYTMVTDRPRDDDAIPRSEARVRYHRLG